MLQLQKTVKHKVYILFTFFNFSKIMKSKMSEYCGKQLVGQVWYVCWIFWCIVFYCIVVDASALLRTVNISLRRRRRRRKRWWTVATFSLHFVECKFEPDAHWNENSKSFIFDVELDSWVWIDLEKTIIEEKTITFAATPLPLYRQRFPPLPSPSLSSLPTTTTLSSSSANLCKCKSKMWVYYILYDYNDYYIHLHLASEQASRQATRKKINQ